MPLLEPKPLRTRDRKTLRADSVVNLYNEAGELVAEKLTIKSSGGGQVIHQPRTSHGASGLSHYATRFVILSNGDKVTDRTLVEVL